MKQDVDGIHVVWASDLMENSCESCNEPMGSIKAWEFVCWFLSMSLPCGVSGLVSLFVT